MTAFDIIYSLNRKPCITGYEQYTNKNDYASILPDFENWKEDEVGNLYYEIKGEDPSKTLLVEAHRDVIGLCIKKHLGDSFYSVSNCGGIDPTILPSTRLLIHASSGSLIPAVLANKPPHVLTEEERNKKQTITDIYLDTGIAQNGINPGDPVQFDARPKMLFEDKITSCGLDNGVGVASLLLALMQIKKARHNVIFLLSSSEETNSRGVSYFLRNNPIDGAIVIDAGFHYYPGLDKTKCILMGKGPSVSITDTLSQRMSHWVSLIAKQSSLPLQTVCEPGGTGTSATAIQIRNSGIPSAVISIPIANMHTPSEIVKSKDIDLTSELVTALCQNPLFQEHGGNAE